MLSVKRALLMSVGERYVLLVTNFATAALVSRILTPQEIGVSVIGMAIMATALSLREFSSSSFLIQRKELSREDIRGAFTVTFILTGVIAAALVAASPFLASFYREPNLVPYFRVISVCLFLDASSTLIIALLRREMSFGKVAAIDIAGAVANSAATMALALAGFSYMSFAWAWLIGSGLAAVLALALCPHFWMFKPSLANWRGMISFGGYNGVIAILFRIFDALPLLLLGRVVSPNAAALFSRTLWIGQIPDKLVIGGAMAVVLPAFSAEVRQGRDLKRPYLAALSLVTALHWPALLVLSVLAYPIVNIVLGHQWTEAAPLVQIVAIALLFSFSFELNYPVMVALGAIRDLFIRALIVFPISGILLSVAVVFGGLQAAAWCMLVTIPFQAFIALGFVRRRLGLRRRDIAAALWKSAVVALASAAPPLAGIGISGSGFGLSNMEAIAAGSLAVGGWVAGLIITRHPLLDEIIKIFPALRRAWASAG
ncbi:oligosaccharide flippase family protein [Mesorhizobium abyssinicae]|uniref:oligosaccharide flippase family protein n=1 Tax=Mesorhizobium TaxID=68287 RepID=UPI000FE86C39|nr:MULTISPECIES: oligosaccharide flippase family protein [Mesorhizobium]MDX8434621.1 oligosaccharide flippase family protein [Mesorhizobium abyssinicae]RWF34150.1 MAG: sugar transporter [Mesorhizobium sp.]RWF42886.1 MAG: sugar transporter [Mesorhizobium sp.]TIX19169.1 MAG: sugar transporter [Mesorhizobium sp.]TJW03340.1 MAG: sugar transporter [Mesorhizobium sp.]